MGIKAIRIRARRQRGFWRCGVFHPGDKWVSHPAGRFGPEEIKRLQEEERLQVEIVEAKPELKAVNPPLIEAVKKAAADRGGQKPNVKEVEAILGRDITAAQRDQAWDQLQARADKE
ncbi:MAG: hypothetical protein JRJ59_11180 [Deltaproteobacteria bacterium]|nr:hypothetical protein [Deltaproteobacteria bacterium]